MAQALVATDLDLPADVALDLAAEVTLYLVVALDVVTKDGQLLVGEVLGAQIRADARTPQDLQRPGATDAENVGERDLHALVAREINAG